VEFGTASADGIVFTAMPDTWRTTESGGSQQVIKGKLLSYLNPFPVKENPIIKDKGRSVIDSDGSYQLSFRAALCEDTAPYNG
jgi:hypothetical protein